MASIRSDPFIHSDLQGHQRVCDPTYIGASVGHTMPDMDNSSATSYCTAIDDGYGFIGHPSLLPTVLPSCRLTVVGQKTELFFGVSGSL